MPNIAKFLLFVEDVAELIDDHWNVKEEKRKEKYKQRSKSQKYDLLDHFMKSLSFSPHVRTMLLLLYKQSELTLPFMRQEYLCDGNRSKIRVLNKNFLKNNSKFKE